MTHYANDYFDFEADCANTTPTRWSGGSRVLPNSELPRRVALIGALAFGGIGATMAAVIAFSTGVWTGPTFLAILVLAWEYSAPPLRLCASGAGELDTAIVVACLVPWVAFYLEAPDLVGIQLLVLAIVPLALLQVAMLLAIEFPDAAGDALMGKRTLVVRLGATRAARWYAIITAAAFCWLPLGWKLGLPLHVALMAALPAPLALWRILRIADHRVADGHARMTFFAVLLLISTTGCMLLGFLTS